MTTRSSALIILQARMGSRRLPGKVLAPVAGWPLVEYCLARLQASGVGEVVLATTTDAEDSALVALGKRVGVPTVTGPGADVLGRFAQVLEGWPEATLILRATAENPFVDMDAPARILRALADGADYAVEEGLPLGAAVEGVRREVLLQAHREAAAPYDREHVTPWVTRADRCLRVAPGAPAHVRAPDLRLTVDTAHDLARVRRLADGLTAAGGDPRLAPLAQVIDVARHGAIQEVA